MKAKDEIKGLTTCKIHKNKGKNNNKNKNLINKSTKTLTNFLHFSIEKGRGNMKKREREGEV